MMRIDKILENKKQYYVDNRDKILENTKQYYVDNKEKILERYKRNNFLLRCDVLRVVGRGCIRCVVCGCNNINCLEINHKYGGGNKERKIYGKNAKSNHNHPFYKDIMSGKRSIDDLEIRCKPCNGVHYLETKFNIHGFKIIWNPNHTEPPLSSHADLL